ncbi:MAG: putative GTP-binding protein EngB [Tenericutes bacterium ADurb.BinA155]|jgi:GTP-binding protein|nr:MAG: putative GTP-binding protein EngB [Tenericutes bacterium ADurb.BinA155]
MIDFRKVRFIVSAPSLKEKPKDGKPALLFVGRSNVGKSTLINSLCAQKIAFSSKKAGKTKLLNYFLVDDAFYLVDAPGYGSTIYANLSTINFAKMMEDYVQEPSLKAIVFLSDLRHEPGKDDVAFITYLQKTGVPLINVLTKCDQMNQKELGAALKMAKTLGLKNPILSKNDLRSLDPLKAAIMGVLA